MRLPGRVVGGLAAAHVAAFAACGRGDGAGPALAPPDAGATSYVYRAVGSGPLRAGAAAVDITPTEYETFRDCGADGLCPGDPGFSRSDPGEGNAVLDEGEAFLDCGLDRICPGDPAWTGPDSGEGDGKFQGIYLAGFQGMFGKATGGRPMQGAHDPVEARLFYLEQGPARLLVLAFDVVGLMPKYVNMLKRRIEADHGIPRGAIVVAALHDHEAPDSMGLWSENGVAAWWIEPAMERVLSAVGPLVATAEPVRLRAAAAYPFSCADRATGAPKRMDACDEPSDEASAGAHDRALLQNDLRDPWVRDMLVSAARLEDDDGIAVATVVGWSSHPESLSDGNPLASADFPGFVRRRVESQSGGVAVYWSGAVGGMMSPLRGALVPRWTEDGTRLPGPDLSKETGYERTMSLGYEVGQTALDALAAAPVAPSADLLVETVDFDVPLPGALKFMFSLTQYYDESDRAQVPCGDDECLRTQVTHARLGPLDILTVPGELFPEYLVGRKAVTVPYAGWPAFEFRAVNGLRAVSGAPVPMLVGLANVELGYLMPEGDFLEAGGPFVGSKDPAKHPNFYEESLCPGKRVGDAWCARARALYGAGGSCSPGGQ